MPLPPHAVILAAGLGSRLNDARGELPKTMVPVGGRSILSRSLEVLRGFELSGLTVVVGHRGEVVRKAVAEQRPGASVIVNSDPGRTGSMRSLALAWEAIDQQPSCVLVIEGDLVYGADALEALFRGDRLDVILVSTPTDAGDEVWVRGDGERVIEICKEPAETGMVLGELIGLSLLSREAMDDLVRTHRNGGDAVAMEHYEERISARCSAREFRAEVVHGLAWGEVDDLGQLLRVEREVIPLITALGAGRAVSPSDRSAAG